MRSVHFISRSLDRQRGHLFPWTPVCLAIGIALYFSLKSEPTATHLLALLGVCLLGIAAARGRSTAVQASIVALILTASGFSLAAWRANDVAAAKLTYRYYGPIEGRIINVDRSHSDAVRLTLDRVRLAKVPPAKTPQKVRVSLHGTQGYIDPMPGQIVITTGHLSPPNGPVEPGGFDFQRQAWFQGLGAVGYTRTPVLLWGNDQTAGLGLAITKWRLSLSRAVQSEIPGRAGAFAAAITTGDRSGMSQETLEDLRAANLAHLLAISGLHMGLMTGFVFAALRFGLALVPYIALRVSVKKIGAIGALLVGAVYLVLSGGNVATERAYVMVATMLFAVLADRRAITLRAVALAALIVLTMRPETLLGPGFQMSFAATIALVATYGFLREQDWSTSKWPKPLRYVGGVVLSSAIAGLATAPIAAAHFNQIPHYGLLANMLSVPLMGVIIIPAAVLAALLWPVGLSWIGLSLMAAPINWILGVAHFVAEMPGALSFIWSPEGYVLPLLTLGVLWIVLWQERTRKLGLLPVAASVWLWATPERPDVLISDTGGLVGVKTEQGRALSKPRGNGFAADNWLENDGDPVDQAVAFSRAQRGVNKKYMILSYNGVSFLHATGKNAARAAINDCRSADFVVVNVKSPATQGCTILDVDYLAKTGSLAITIEADGTAEITTARSHQGQRLWSQ